MDIADILDDYSSEIQEGLESEASSTAKEIVKELKMTTNTYKVRTGNYNKGWKVNTKKGRGYINCLVWNSTDWRLTHLLENGHITRSGSRTRAFPHIKPVESKYVIKYTQNVEKIIKNGGNNA